jgi:hypothetical protein
MSIHPLEKEKVRKIQCKTIKKIFENGLPAPVDLRKITKALGW